jgi:DNA-binding IclR family transcriptional regulator
MLNKANDILSLFSPERPELAVLEVAELLGRPRSSVYRLLARMATAGFLDQDPNTGRYRVGIRLAGLGELARHSTSLQRVAYPELCRLGEVTGESATLMVRSGQEGVTIDVVETYHPLRIPQHLGGRFPLNATAGGKVLLAWQPEADIEEFLRRPLLRCTAATITNPAKLRRELEITRQRGYGLSAGEWFDDVFAVAAPVRDHRSRVLATVAVACPPSRWNTRTIKGIAAACQRAAEAISRAMGHSEASFRRAALVR